MELDVSPAPQDPELLEQKAGFSSADYWARTSKDCVDS